MNNRLFAYRKRTMKGILVRGTIFAKSKQEAKNLLANNSEVLIHLHKLNLWQSWRYKITEQQLLRFFQDLESLSIAGVSIVNSLMAIEKSGYLPHSLSNIIALVENGQLLSNAITNSNFISQEVVVSALKNAENYGNYSQEFHNISNYLNWRIKFKQNLSKSLAYPVLLLIFCMSLISFLINYVIPGLQDLYTSTQQEIPTAIGLLNYFYNGLKFLALTILMVILMIYTILLISKKIPITFMKINHKISQFLLKLPYLGEQIKKIILLQYFEICSALSKIDTNPIVEIMQTAHNNVFPKLFRPLFAKIQQQVQQGESLSNSMELTINMPNIVTNMLKVAEQSGSYSKNFSYIVDYLHNHLMNSLNKVTSYIGVVPLIFIGSILILIVASVFLPIYDTLGQL